MEGKGLSFRHRLSVTGARLLLTRKGNPTTIQSIFHAESKCNKPGG